MAESWPAVEQVIELPPAVTAAPLSVAVVKLPMDGEALSTEPF